MEKWLASQIDGDWIFKLHKIFPDKYIKLFTKVSVLVCIKVF